MRSHVLVALNRSLVGSIIMLCRIQATCMLDNRSSQAQKSTSIDVGHIAQSRSAGT